MTPYTLHIDKAIFRTIRKTISIVILVAFVISSVKSPAFAQSAQLEIMPRLPVPGAMVHLSPEFTPAHLQGLTIHPDNALQFDFLIYRGDDLLTDEQKKSEYNKLVKYFLASLTIPDADQWVNLSPYEKDRIIKDDFGKTEMGRDLLAQDYILKQITSSLIYPEEGLGKKFWEKVYDRAYKEYGVANIPVNTFNKVWIVPDEAAVYESGNTVYVLRDHLKVMLEEDYLSLEKHSGIASSPASTAKTHSIGSQVIREIILPELEREVNEDKNFANLRQIYSGMILATWYKHELRESLLGKVYADRSKVKGVDQNPKTNQLIYQRYLKAFKKGVFNYIKEDMDKYTNEMIPRKYFSGGMEAFTKGIVKGSAAMTSHYVQGEVLDWTPEQVSSLPLNMRKSIGDPASLTNNIDRATVSMNQALQPEVYANAAMASNPALEISRKIYSITEKLRNLKSPGARDIPGVRDIFDARDGLIDILNKFSDLLDVYLSNEQRKDINPLLDTILKGLKGMKVSNDGVNNRLIADELSGYVSRASLYIPDRRDASKAMTAAQAKQTITAAIAYVRKQLAARFSGNKKVNAPINRDMRRLEILPAPLAFYKAEIASIQRMGVPADNSELMRKNAIYGVLKLMRQPYEFPAFLLSKVNPIVEQDLIPTINELLNGHDTEMNRRKLLEAEQNILAQMPQITQESFADTGTGYTAVRNIRASLTERPPSKKLTVRLPGNPAKKIIRLGDEVTIGNTGPFNVSDVRKTLERMKKIVDPVQENISPDTRFVTLASFAGVESVKDFEITMRLLETVGGQNDLLFERDRDTIGLKFHDFYNVEETGESIDEKIDQVLTAVQQIVGDAAMKAPNRPNRLVHIVPVQGQAAFVKGGIDLNSANLNLQIIKRDGKGIPLPLAQQDMAQLSRIQGFEPEIIEIQPAVNIPIISELQQKLQST